MWPSRLFWKLFLTYAGLTLALTVAFLFAVTSWRQSDIYEQVEHRLHDTAIVLRSHAGRFLSVIEDDTVDPARRAQTKDELQEIVQLLSAETKTRLTIINSSGEVLADSEKDPKTMMNHADRPELIAAAKTGKGIATRRSPTLGFEMFYFALPVEDDRSHFGFVRVAVGIDTINQRVATVRRFLWSFAIALAVVAVVLTYVTLGRIINPLTRLTQRVFAIARGENDDPLPVESSDEVGMLAQAFNQMQLQLANRVRQLRANNAQMATVLSSMDEGIIAVDHEEKVLLANDASKSFLDFAKHDAIGCPLSIAVRSLPLHNIVRQCLQTGGSAQDEFEAFHQSPRVLTVRASCLPGIPSPGVVAVLHDITELRHLENHRRDFIANVSHELKTPLAAIKAYAETLRLGAINDSKNNRNFLARIEEQADRLHQLILDMLQIARMEAGEAAFEITPVPLDEIVNSCIAQHMEAAELKQINLSVEPPDCAVSVRSDVEGLRTILANLIDNAIKYTTGGGCVTVRWRADGDYAILEVQDTGIGIAKQDQARVFERFYRTDKARSRDLGGTGLGLSIVKHLAQAFGGSVDLESQPGQGSTFKVRLPLK